MQPEAPKQPNKREITYQVGWKKGRMEAGKNEKDRVVISRHDHDVKESAVWVRLLERTAWKPTFRISDPVMSAILWSLAPIAFAVTWLLVFLLGRQ